MQIKQEHVDNDVEFDKMLIDQNQPNVAG